VLYLPQLSNVARHGKMHKVESQEGCGRALSSGRWQHQVPKSYFWHMYVVGVFVSMLFLVSQYLHYLEITANTNNDVDPYNNRNSLLTILFGCTEEALRKLYIGTGDGVRNSSKICRMNPGFSSANIVHIRITLLFCFLLHSARRFLECVYITSYGNSKMHVLGYLCGLFHYVLVPVCLVLANDDQFLFTVKSHESSCYTPFHRLPVALLLYVAASYQQFISHKILYDLKTHASANSHYRQRGKKSRTVGGTLQSYKVPRGSLFEYVCCPHYLQEIIIYFSFYLISPSSPTLLFLFIWVTANLSVVSCNQLQWYKEEFSTNKLPKHWKRIFPFIF